MTETTATASWAEEARKNSGWLIALGVLQIIVGILAIGSPLMTGVAATFLIGVFMIVGGAMRLVGSFKAGSFGTGLLAFLAGLLTTVAGFMILARPGIGLVTLTLLLAAYFFASGVAQIILGFHARPERGWGWLVFDGVVALILGLLIGRQWPLSGVWAVGTLVGIYILISGWSELMIGLGVRGASKAIAESG